MKGKFRDKNLVVESKENGLFFVLLFLATLILWHTFYKDGSINHFWMGLPATETVGLASVCLYAIGNKLHSSIEHYLTLLLCRKNLMPLPCKFWSILNQAFLMQFHVFLWNYCYTKDQFPLYPRAELNEVKLLHHIVWDHSTITTFK